MKTRDQEHATIAPYLLFGLSLSLLFTYPISVVQADTPITSSGLNTHVSGTLNVDGQTQFDITGGTRPGGGANLYHSFGDFNVPNHTIANFLNDSGLATSNILGRVTGGNISNIFGTIQTTGFDHANLFLMNPAGFLFGPNVTLNVGGMVTFTTADYLKLADGARFNAIPKISADALLSAAPLAAFGFLGSNPGAITVQGSHLSVAEGTGLSLVGGTITVQSGTLDNGTVQPAQLSAPGGQINLVSVDKAPNQKVGGEVVVNGSGSSADLVPTGFKSLGSITLSQGSAVDTSGVPGIVAGKVSIRGGQFVMDASSITALSQDSSGKGGNIEVTANTVALSNQSSLRTSAENGSLPIPGDITVNAQTFSATNSEITILRGGGDGGNIPNGNMIIQGLDGAGSSAKLVSLTNSTLSNESGAQSSGPIAGGYIAIQAKDVMLNQSVVKTLTIETPGGPISIVADRQIQSIDSHILSPVALLNVGGPIALQAGVEINLANTEISSSLSGGGDISLSAPVISLHGGIVNANANVVRLEDVHPAGTILIEATRAVQITDGARISADSTQADIHGPANNGGNIIIHAGAKFVIENSTLSAQSPLGNGGTIEVQADQVQITNSQLTTSVVGGPSSVAGTITMDGNAVKLTNSQILSTATEGHGGNINITTPKFRSTGSVLDVSSQFGTDGTVTIHP